MSLDFDNLIGPGHSIMGLRRSDLVTESSLANICKLLGCKCTPGLIKALEMMEHEEILAWFVKTLVRDPFSKPNDSAHHARSIRAGNKAFCDAIDMCRCTNERIAVHRGFLPPTADQKKLSFDEFAEKESHIVDILDKYFILSEEEKQKYFQDLVNGEFA